MSIKLYFNPNTGSVWNNRIDGVKAAIEIICNDCMINAYKEIAYGQTTYGDFVLRFFNTTNDYGVLVVFKRDHLIMYYCDSNSNIIPGSGNTYLYNSIIHNNTCDVIYGMLRNCANREKIIAGNPGHHDNPVWNELWRSNVNHNIEQLRNIAEFLGTINLKHGQAFYGYESTFGRLVVWYKNLDLCHNLISDNPNNIGIIVEAEGAGIIAMYKADQFGNRVNGYRVMLDRHWFDSADEAHSRFIKITSKIGVTVI